MECRFVSRGMSNHTTARTTQASRSTHRPQGLTTSQQEGLTRLKAFLAIKRQVNHVAGISPRPIPLIVGPSGAGKTTLVRHFAQSEGLEMMDFCSATWLPSGAHGTPTVTTIRKFVEKNDAGILFIDELDKFSASQDYYRSVQQEVYALTDGRVSSFEGWTPEIQKKFRENFFIVGAGTWQHLFKKQTKPGRLNLDGQDSIPEELLMRFNAMLIVLDPPTPDYFRERFLELHRALRVALPSPERLTKLVDRAVASKKNNRAIEAYLSYLLEKNYRAGNPLLGVPRCNWDDPIAI